ncbi:ATP-binding protein [Halorussus amylolyticus]|uniref:ATP-binding protein n=1 Tax=Halorussus amylolyticus TaxID=1126242 RepID=UPI0010530C81|nr:ATP-binding protein [Halorussus amylolyticus]
MRFDSLRTFDFHPRPIPAIISGVGVLFLFSFAAEWVLFHGLGNLSSVDFLASLLISVIFTASIVYGGYRLARSDLPAERHPRIVAWIVGCSLIFFAINVPIMVAWVPNTLPAQVLWVRFVASVGVTSGLLIGSIEARAIQRGRAAERAAVRAEEAELHHQHLDYLNSLLRHEVLNTANVITGYASLLLDDDQIDPDARDRVETIFRQGQDMTNVVRDVQVLIAATRGTAGLESVNLSDVLVAELDDIRRTTESVAVEASIPDGVYVVADDLLPRVFSNLLTNAVEHNDADTPSVTVTLEQSGDTATVRIADDGPGISEDERATLFERGDNTGAEHGLGLYLVRTLTERYDGTVELVETGDDGSEFAVTLLISTLDTDASAVSVGSDAESARSTATD